MFRVEMEARLYMGVPVEEALEGTVKTMMERGSDVMGAEMANIDQYKSLKEQLEKNKHG
jgi:hypothetical protein